MSDGKIILQGREELIKPVITMLFAMHEMLEDKDVGEIVAQDLSSAVRGKKIPKLILCLHYATSDKPPYNKRVNGKLITPRYNIPFVKRTALEHDKIVAAMGGSNGYMWGHWKARAELSEGNGQLTVYGGTKSGAIERLEALASLSSADILSLNATEELNKGVRTKDSHLWKESVKVYPHYCTIINQGLITFGDKKKGVQTLDGDFSRKKSKLWLYFKPTDWDKTITELLKKSEYGD